MEETCVRCLTMESLNQRIKEKCSFLPSNLKYMDSDKDWIDLSSEDSDSFVDMIESEQAVPERENLYRIILKVSNTTSPLVLIHGDPVASKRFHSPSPQKPKKRVRGRLDFEDIEPNGNEDNTKTGNTMYTTPTQKYFDKLHRDISLQQSLFQEKDREIRQLEESYTNTHTDSGPKCTNCHTSGHNKSNCMFPPCVSASICNDIKRHADESKYVKAKKDELKAINAKLNAMLEESKSKKQMYEKARNTFASQVQADLINSNQQKYLRKTLIGQSVPNWLAVNSDIRKLEKICRGKVPPKSEIQHLIKQFDEGFCVLQSSDQSSSTTPCVNPVKALWEMKGIHFPGSHALPNQQFPSEFDGASATVSASKLDNLGEPKSKFEEDSFLEIGLKKSLEDINSSTPSTALACETVAASNTAEADDFEGLDLLFKAAYIVDREDRSKLN